MAAVVTVRAFAAAAEALGARVIELDAASVPEALSSLRRTADPRFEEILSTCSIWLGDEPVRHDEAVVLRDGDEIAILPPVSGGAS